MVVQQDVTVNMGKGAKSNAKEMTTYLLVPPKWSSRSLTALG